MFSIAKELFIVSPFTYILTYKFSQDHIELLFGRVRQRFGANNNPNVTQFKTAIKQILLKNAIKCKSNGNCNTFDDDPAGSLFEFKWAKKNNFEDFQERNSDANEDNIIQNKVDFLNNLNLNNLMYESKNNILYYIAGYIVRKIKLNCTSCKRSLLMQKYDHDYVSSPLSKLVNFKNRGGLIYSSDCVFKIIY